MTGTSAMGNVVVVADIDEDAAGRTAREINGTAQSAIVDVKDREALEKLATDADAAAPIHVWVNSAVSVRW